MIGAVILNVWKSIATMATKNPHGYIFTLFGYLIIFSIIGYIIYRISYNPPEFENLVDRAQKRQDKLLDGLKTKIDTIDDKQAKKKKEKAKKKEELKAKILAGMDSTSNKSKVQKSQAKSSSTSNTSSNKSKSKAVRRRH